MGCSDSAKGDDIGPSCFEPSIPPGFETYGLHEKDQGSSNNVPDSLHMAAQNGEAQVSEENKIDEEGESGNDFQEVKKTWSVRKQIGLFVENEGDIIQAIMEDRKEWKSAKNRNKQKKGKQTAGTHY